MASPAAAYDAEQGNDCEALKCKDAHRVKRGNHEHLEREQYRQQRKQPVGIFAP